MTVPSPQTAIIVPARNEAAHIGSCLAALGPQIRAAEGAVIVVINQTSDATAAAARQTARRHAVQLHILHLRSEEGSGVGAARRAGMACALRLWPEIRCLLTTDADCRAAPDWLTANLSRLRTADVVCGMVEPEPDEIRRLPARFAEIGALEHRAIQLSRRFRALIDPDATQPNDGQGQAAGASLAFQAAAYVAAGGFSALPSGEDRELVARMSAQGLRIAYEPDARVFASCRLEGRAPHGMADALRLRLYDPGGFIDEEVRSVSFTIAAAGASPDLRNGGPDSGRVRIAQLPAHIAGMDGLVRSLEAFETPDLRRAWLRGRCRHKPVVAL